jgi:hypothetical protein
MHSRDSFTATLPFLFNKTHSTEFLFWVCVICFLLSLDSIRALATSLSTPSKRCTINDVLMGIVAGGLRGYLELSC